MRIALLSYRSKTHCGGQGVYVRHLSRGLVELGHDVEVFSGQPYPEGLDPRVRLTKVPSLDLYREPDPFRVPWPSEIKTRIDLLELLTTWTAGFPEPRTFSLRAARILAERLHDFDVVHDNQCLGTGLLKIADLGLPVVATVHHPITRDRILDVAAARWWRKPLVRRWYGFAEMQENVARQIPELLTVSSTSAADIAEDFGVAPEPAACGAAGRGHRAVQAGRATGPQPHHRNRQRGRAAEGRQPPAACGRAAACRTRPGDSAGRQARAQRAHREADRRTGHLRHRAQLQWGVRLRTGRPIGVRRNRLHPFALRGILAACGGGDGQWHADRGQPCRRAARSRRCRRRMCAAGAARRRRRTDCRAGRIAGLAA